MAANDWRTGTYAIDPQGRGNFNNQQEGLKGQEWLIVRYFDASSVNMAAADTFKVATIGAGVLVNGVWHIVGTAEGGTATMDIGDSSSATAFHSNADNNGTAATVTAATTQVKYYSAADYILLTNDHALDAAKFWIVVRCVRLT